MEVRSTRDILIMVNRIIRIMETKGFTRTEASICLAAATTLVPASHRLRTNEDDRPTWTPEDNNEVFRNDTT